MWTEDGGYEVPGIGSYIGRGAIVDLLEADIHQGLLRDACAHVKSLSHVVIDG